MKLTLCIVDYFLGFRIVVGLIGCREAIIWRVKWFKVWIFFGTISAFLILRKQILCALSTPLNFSFSVKSWLKKVTHIRQGILFKFWISPRSLVYNNTHIFLTLFHFYPFQLLNPIQLDQCLLIQSINLLLFARKICAMIVQPFFPFRLLSLHITRSLTKVLARSTWLTAVWWYFRIVV